MGSRYRVSDKMSNTGVPTELQDFSHYFDPFTWVKARGYGLEVEDEGVPTEIEFPPQKAPWQPSHIREPSFTLSQSPVSFFSNHLEVINPASRLEVAQGEGQGSHSDGESVEFSFRGRRMNSIRATEGLHANSVRRKLRGMGKARASGAVLHV